MNVVMIGTGYVGLVSGACFAEFGAEVHCLDVDEDKIARLERGEVPIYEPGLEDLVARNVAAGRLSFGTEFAVPVAAADLVFIAVGTPTRRGDGHADLRYVYAAARDVARHLAGYTVVVDKSTVPVGTARQVARIIAETNPEADFDVASNPEFLREGAAIADFMRPDRVVIGVESERAEAALRALYRPLNLIEVPIVATNLESAELVKYASNAFLATKISFINEMAALCEEVGADVHAVARGMGLDGRIGRKFLHPGPGFGGSCFEGDATVFVLNSPHVHPRPLASFFAEAGSPPPGQAAGIEIQRPADTRVLALDPDAGRPVVARVTALTRRRYRGTMVTVTASMGRRIRVTADHPLMVVEGDGAALLPASAVAPGDQLMALTELPALEASERIDLIEQLRGSDLQADVFVRPRDGASFRQQYRRFAAHIDRRELKHPEEIRRHNRMRLWLYCALSEQGVLDVPHEALELYTAKGAATNVPAVIPVDADLMRLLGYYVAEGFVAREGGRGTSVRARIGFSFHQDEREYIDDVRRILGRWGVKCAERGGQRSTTVVASSRVLAWLLEEVLGCGGRAEDKAPPKMVFNVEPKLRREFLRGAFSGDGAVTLLQQGRNMMFEYATVSRPLADGLALLLQSIGIVPALYERWMNKSKREAYILRVSGYAQLDALRALFGDKHRATIDRVLDGYQRHIRQRGFNRRGPYVALTVQSVDYEEVDTAVYSLETETGTVVIASGLVCHNCFPKDTLALVRIAQEAGAPCRIVEAVVEVNAAQRQRMVRKIRAALGGDEAGKTIAVLGLTFKPETDDMRDAPALGILPSLIERGAKVRAHDPQGVAEARALLPEAVEYCDDIYETLAGADALVLMTEWNAYRGLDLARCREAMRGNVFVDLRNVYEPEEMHAAGFEYRCVGRA